MNYSAVVHKLRVQIHEFSGKLSAQFSRSKQRFIEQMVYGICARQEVKLSEIARSLEEMLRLSRPRSVCRATSTVMGWTRD